MTNNFNSDEFLTLLAMKITSKDINVASPELQIKIKNECFDMLKEYVVGFVEVKYGKKEAIRIKAGFQYKQNIFLKFPNDEKYLQEAYLDFLKQTN
jgi:hypothetical protein